MMSSTPGFRLILPTARRSVNAQPFKFKGNAARLAHPLTGYHVVDDGSNSIPEGSFQVTRDYHSQEKVGSGSQWRTENWAPVRFVDVQKGNQVFERIEPSSLDLDPQQYPWSAGQ